MLRCNNVSPDFSTPCTCSHPLIHLPILIIDVALLGAEFTIYIAASHQGALELFWLQLLKSFHFVQFNFNAQVQNYNSDLCDTPTSYVLAAFALPPTCNDEAEQWDINVSCFNYCSSHISS